MTFVVGLLFMPETKDRNIIEAGEEQPGSKSRSKV
jgi:hypothetical protein